MNFTKSILLLFIFQMLLSESMGQNEPNFALAGFATETTGTTGGKGGTTITVYTGNELQEAIKNHKNSDTPLTIFVEGHIKLSNSLGIEKIEVKDVENLSIIGTANGADFEGIGIKVRRVSNLVIRNISIHHVLSGEKDCINIEGPCDHIWIDHCELYNEYGDVDGDGDLDDNDKDYYDGLLDTKKDVSYVTYSWNYLHGSWKTSLVGSSESDTYDRKMTLHHNYYEDCYSRLPLFRGGTGHIFNCYYNNIVSTCINTRQSACIRIENNFFENAKNPWVSAYSDILGGAELINNERLNSPSDFSSNDTFEPENCIADVPYSYQAVLSNPAEVKNNVKQYAGVGKLSEPDQFETIGEGNTNTVSKFNNNAIQTYPNPAKDKIVINFLSNNSKADCIKIFDSRGRCHIELSKGKISEISNTITIDINQLNSGLYFIESYSKNQIIKSKFIKL